MNSLGKKIGLHKSLDCVKNYDKSAYLWTIKVLENMVNNSYKPLSLSKKVFLFLFVLKLKFEVLSVWYMISFNF